MTLEPAEERRVRVVEDAVSRLDERVKGVAEQVRDVADDVRPQSATIATLAQQVEQMGTKLDELGVALSKRDADSTLERRNNRTALLGLIGTLGATAITVSGGLVAILLR